MLDFDANATRALLPAAWHAYAQATAQCAQAGSDRTACEETLTECARQDVATAFGAHPDEVVFCGGGSHADALVLWAASQLNRSSSGPRTNFGLTSNARAVGAAPHAAVLSAFEHRAMQDTARALADAGRLRPIWAAVAADGHVDVGAAVAACTSEVVLLSVLHAHNETGVVQPWPALREALARRRQRTGAPLPPLLHADAVQSAGRVPLHFASSPMNLLTLSGHKLGAVGGSGALLTRRGSAVHAQFVAADGGAWRQGALEHEARCAPLWSSLAAACRHLPGTVAAQQRLRPHRDEFERRVRAALGDGVTVVGAQQARLPNTSLLRLAGVPAEALLIALDLAGFAVSSGAACSAGAVEASTSLLAMGFTPAQARECVRISLHAHAGPTPLQASLHELADAIAAFAARAQRMFG